MVRLLAIVGMLALGVSALGFVSIRSDIQLIVAVVGFFSAFILFGIAAVLDKLKT